MSADFWISDLISFVACFTWVIPLAKPLAIEGILSAPKMSKTIKKIKTISAPLMNNMDVVFVKDKPKKKQQKNIAAF
jgi:hypothetical protein